MQLPRFTAVGVICALAVALPASALARPGDVFIADSNYPPSGAVFKVGPAGGPPAILADGDPFKAPLDLVIDPGGTLLVANSSAGAIFSVDRATGAVTTFLQSATIPEPAALALAPGGQLYVADDQGPEVFRVDLRTKAITALPDTAGVPDWTAAYSMTVARNGTLFFDDGNDEVFQRPPGGPVTKLYEGPLVGNADGLALSADERFLFVGNGNLGGVVVIDLRTGAASPYAATDIVDGLASLHDGGLISGSDDKLERIGPGGSPVTTFSSSTDYTYAHGIAVEPPLCRGRLATVVGTTGRDLIEGSRFADVISTLGGNDVARGLGGKDILCGGKGRDRLLGGGAADRLLGGPGGDRLLGGSGRDRLLGGPGRDRLLGGPGRDRLRGGPGRDRQRQ